LTNTPSRRDDRITVLDDRLLPMAREEAKTYLDEHIQKRGLADARSTTRNGEKQGRPLAAVG
jgi:hypothetical protein